MWRLGLRGFFRGLHGASELEVMSAGDLLVGVKRKRVRVALDGEVARLRSPLRYRMRQDALRVLAATEGDAQRGQGRNQTMPGPHRAGHS
jgi:hypothetical protein